MGKPKFSLLWPLEILGVSVIWELRTKSSEQDDRRQYQRRVLPRYQELTSSPGTATIFVDQLLSLACLHLRSTLPQMILSPRCVSPLRREWTSMKLAVRPSW